MPLSLQLQLLFRPSIFSKPDIMLDDIKFENCADGDVLEGSDQLSCSFDNDTCSWYADYTASILWKKDKKGLDEGGEFICFSLFCHYLL